MRNGRSGPRMAAASRAKGMEDVVLGDSAITLVAGESGGLAYRGFDIHELVPNATYEGVVQLLLDGSPPLHDPPEEIVGELRRRRVLDETTARRTDSVPPGLPPLEALRSLVSLLGGPRWTYPPTRDQALELVAKTPTLLARYVRRTAGQAPLPDRPELGHAAHYLYPLTGAVPDPASGRALEQVLRDARRPRDERIDVRPPDRASRPSPTSSPGRSRPSAP